MLYRLIREHRWNFFGNVVLGTFLVANALDWALTYWAVNLIGLDVEFNPLMRWSMLVLGTGLGLAIPKLMAMVFGILISLSGRHVILALSTVFIIATGTLPWLYIFIALTH